MPTIRLSPEGTSYWIASGEQLEVPSTPASAPTIANEVQQTTGIAIGEQELHLSVLGVSKLSIQSTGIITVAGTAAYENLVIDDDHIPNKKYVDDAILAVHTGHTHTESEISDLQSYALDTHNHDADYANISHNHGGLYALAAHTHVEADISDLQAYALDADVVKLTGNQTVAGTKTFSDAPVLPSYTVATLPAGTAGAMIFVTDETGGAIPAFHDGTDWRRVSDRAVVS